MSPFSPAEIRREFPVERAPSIVRANGSISRAALQAHFSALGCPHAKAEIAVAVLKSGGTETAAIHLAMLAAYYTDPHGPSIEPMERTTRAMLEAAKLRHAQLSPRGLYAEERAARLEGRESRWGSRDFHFASEGENVTKYYPFREGGAL